MDYLWSFLCREITVAELVDCLTAVIEELEQGRLLPLVYFAFTQISKENQSNFARVVKSSLLLSSQKTVPDYDQQKDALGRTFDYWLEQPLECLIDMGICKLIRDAKFILQTYSNFDQLVCTR